jgi:hypothetical protein
MDAGVGGAGSGFDLRIEGVFECDGPNRLAGAAALGEQADWTVADRGHAENDFLGILQGSRSDGGLAGLGGRRERGK